MVSFYSGISADSRRWVFEILGRPGIGDRTVFNGSKADTEAVVLRATCGMVSPKSTKGHALNKARR